MFCALTWMASGLTHGRESMYKGFVEKRLLNNLIRKM